MPGLDALIRGRVAEAEVPSQESTAHLRLLADARGSADRASRNEVLQLDTGKRLEFNLQNDRVTRLTIDGNLTFTRQGNSDTWQVYNNGVYSWWYGEIELHDNGSYSYQVRGNAEKLTFKRSGNIISTTADGSAVETKADKAVEVTYPDGRSCLCQRDERGNLVAVTDRDGTIWRRDAGDRFVSQKDGSVITAVDVSKNGTFSFTDDQNCKHSISRSGRETVTMPNGAAVELSGGVVAKIKRTDGTNVECRHDQEQRLLSITVGNTTYSRSDGAASNWTIKQPGVADRTFQGNITVTAEGTCIYENTSRKTKEFCTADCRRWLEKEDNSRVELTAARLPHIVHRTNGTTLECVYKDGVMTAIIERGASGSVRWEKKSGEDRWYSNDFPGSQRMNLAVAGDGTLSYESVIGTKYTFNTDGSQIRLKEDRTRTVINPQGQLLQVRRPDGSEINLTWNGNAPAQIEERTAAGAFVWTNNGSGDFICVDKPAESRRNIAFDNDGGFAYLHLKDNEVVGIQYIDGSRREFIRDNGQIAKVVETAKNGASLEWERLAGTNQWRNGTLVEERADVRVSLRSGTYSFRRADGLQQKYLADGTEEIEPGRRAAPERVEQSGLKLWTVVQREFADSKQQEHFRKDMEAFYKRAAVYQVSDEQVARTFETITALLEADDDKAVLKKEQRLELAKELLRHVAYPRAVDQGFHDTCNVTTVQVVLAARHPEKFVDVVKQIALSGEFRTVNGTIVKLDAASLRPDWQAKLYRPYDPARNTHGRSYASQLFQVTAVNAYYASQRLNRRYEQHPPQNPEDTGERLIDTTNNSVVAKVPSLTCDQMIEACRQISGVNCTILESSKLNDQNVVKFQTVDELRDKILDLQSKDKLPAIVMVNTKQEPYFSENGRGRSGRPGGWHVVTVWNIDSRGQLLIDNQWGRRNDNEGFRRMSVAQLFQAAQP